MKRDNKGLTLIELVITVAIIAVFSTVVVNFLTVGSSSYRNTSKTSKVQMDAQKTLDQIQEVVIDTNRGVYYSTVSVTDIDKGTFSPGNKLVGDIDSNTGGQKALMFFNEQEINNGKSLYTADVILWGGVTEKSLRYIRFEKEETASSEPEPTSTPDGGAEPPSGSGTDPFAPAAASEPGTPGGGNQTFQEIIAGMGFAQPAFCDILAGGVTSFNADISKAPNNGAVRFQMTVDNGGKNVTTLHTINLRNQVQIVEDITNAFAGGNGGSGSTDLLIEIRPVPSSIKQGETKRLRYRTSGNGEIDPTTVKWTVTDGDGSFPEQDPTSGKLTADEYAVGSITVYVQANTTDGKTITSSTVTIPVEQIRTLEKLELKEPSKDSILLPSGTSYNLDSDFKWKYVYRDGTEKDADNVTWSVEHSTSAWISPDGYFNSKDWAGKNKDSGTVTVTATGTDSVETVTGNITVKLADLEIIYPANEGVYYTGDSKYCEYKYYEAGEEKTINLSDGNITYKKGEDVSNEGWDINHVGESNFESTDVGNWKITMQHSLSSGLFVEAQSAFKVETVPQEGVLTIGNHFSALQAGQTYACTDNSSWGIKFEKPQSSYHIWTYDINWSIQYGNSGTTITAYSDGHGAELTVGKDEDGFILTAEYKGYEGDTRDKLLETVTVSRKIDVLKELRIVWPKESEAENSNYLNETVANLEKGVPTAFGLDLVIGKVDDSGKHTENIVHAGADGYYNVQWGGELYKYGNGHSERDIFTWTPSGDKWHPENGTNGTGTVTLQESPEVFIKSDNVGYPNTSLKFAIWDEAVTAKICVGENTEDQDTEDQNAEVRMKTGETLELWLELTRMENASSEVPKERDVTWKITGPDSSESEHTTKAGGEGTATTITFNPTTKGIYTVEAVYPTKTGAMRTVLRRIEVE